MNQQTVDRISNGLFARRLYTRRRLDTGKTTGEESDPVDEKIRYSIIIKHRPRIVHSSGKVE